MPTSSLQQRRDQALGAGAELFYDKPIEIVRGEGAYLFDSDGRRYVDMYNNVPVVGHANPAVVKAMSEQQATLNVHSRYLHNGIVEFAERLTGLHHDGMESAVFSCSGTEAVEVAVQIARLVTGGNGIVCTDATYHGNSTLVSAMSYLGDKPSREASIRAFPYPDLYRPLVEGLSDEELSDVYLQEVEARINGLKEDGTGFAALIVCSIFANEGMPNVPAGLMPKLVELVHREGGLVIADEVQSGYGRTGVWWGYDKLGFRPDISVMGKPMGNGLPLSATVTRKDFIDRFRARKDYFNTTASTPLQAAVGMTVIDEIERMNLVCNAAELGDYLTSALKTRGAAYDIIGDVRGYGLFLGVEMVTDGDSKQPDAKMALTLSDRLKDKGFLTSYAGKYNNVLKIRPPLVFSKADAEEFLVAFDASMGEVT